MKVLPDETSYIFENVFTHLPEPVIVMDKEFRILQANNAFISRCNKPASDIRYQSFLKMIQPELDNDNQLRKNLYTELIENQSSQFEAYVQTGPDQGFWSVIDCRLIKHNGRIFFLSVLKELTDHKEAYLSNLDIEKNKGDFENTDNLIQSIAPDGTLLSNNKKWQETLGYTSEELRRLNLTDILREDQIPRCFKLINRVRSGEKCDLIETVFKTRDGRDVFVEGNVDGYFEHGKLLSIRCVFRDKTKSKSLEETYSQLVHNFPVPIYIKRNNQFLFVNPSFEAMTGYGEQELVDRDGLFLVHPEDIPFVQKTAGRLPRTNKSASYEFRLIRKNGESRWVMETIVSISYEGQPALLGNMMDLTERKLVEEALNESKNRYQTLFNSARDAIIIHDLEGKILEVNEAACKMLKYSHNEMLTLSFSDIKSPKYASHIASGLQILLKNGYLQTESENLTRDGKIIPVEINSVLIEYENKKAVLNAARDISERKQAEIARIQNQARLESQLKVIEFKGENSQELLYFALDEVTKLVGGQFGYIYYYDRAQRQFTLNSWSKELMKIAPGLTRYTSFSLDKSELLGDAVRLQKPIIVNSPHKPEIFENGFPNGNYQLENCLIVPVIIARETVAVVGVANKKEKFTTSDKQQITLLMTSIWNTLERWKAQEALSQSEHRYRQLIECSQDGILEISENGQVLMSNPTACKMLGYSEDDMVGLDFSETCLPEERVQAGLRLQRIKSGSILRFERQAVRKNGENFPIDVSISPLPQGRFQEVIRDITVRKKIEQELQESEQKYRLLVENQADLVIELNTKGEYSFVNPAYCKLIGKSREELIGTSSYDLIHPEDRNKVETLNQNNQSFTISSNSELRIKTSLGWRWVAFTSNAVLDNNGQLSAFTCMGRDITEQKEAKEELEKANQRLRELDKLKDNFLSTVSHELRTPLTSIKSFTEILLTYEEDRATQREFLSIINEESDRLTRLINDFLDLSKIQAGRIQWKTEEVSVQDIINQVVITSRPVADQNRLQLNVNIEPSLPLVLFDKDRLTQVITNLMGNAIKFTPEDGRIFISANTEPVNHPGFIIVSIKDSGIGIDPKHYQTIFENFGQVGDVLKDRPKGTGLGLPICKKIIENYSGKIWVESEVGKGATFLFTLPIAFKKSKPELKSADNLPAAKPVNRKTILVVDDEANIRHFIKHELTNKGHNVLEATGGKEAVELARRHHPDLITLDIMMPGLDGLDVTAVLKSDPQTAQIPILVISIVEDMEKAFRLGVNDYLTKPISLEALEQKVNGLLEGNKQQIMCVDDDAAMLKSIEFELGKRGFHTTCCSRGQQAIKLISENLPDLILLDIEMPEMNGFEVLKAIKSNPSTIDIPIIILTGIDIDDGRVRALALGAKEYINKGEGLKRLYEAIDKIIG